MTQKNEPRDPFQFQTPDSIDTENAISLFVDVFKDFYHVINVGNTFIHGPRGSGKSMMFRIMNSDCQMKKSEKKLHELPFYAVHVPIKNTTLRISDIDKLESNYGANYLNEHFMVIYFTICLFQTLAKENYIEYENSTQESIDFFNSYFLKKLKLIGWKENLNPRNDFQSPNEVFNEIKEIFSAIQSEFIRGYILKLSLNTETLNYQGSLALYSDFLFPILQKIRTLGFMPKSPIYLMVDDADELNLTQTKILNSWVSFRATNDVSFKVTTQLRYKTYFATTGTKIDSPHDYFEIDLTEAYTSDKKERYHENVKQIIEKRLKVFGHLELKAEDYFPDNQKQKEELKKLSDELKLKQYDKLKHEFGDNKTEEYYEKAVYDYAYRYTSSEYLKRLEKTGEGHGHNYSYAGFDTLVHLSSNIIRNFIDLASKMYTATYNAKNEEVKCIPVNIQDSEIQSYSNWFLGSNFEKIKREQNLDEIQLDKYNKLYNLIDSMGQAFSIWYKSELSERRVFSFYFEEEAAKELDEVLTLGVSNGFFHKTTKSNKTGTGRAKLYVLNRMLAPLYRLDPVSFSGYLFLRVDKVELAMKNPKAFLKYIEDRIGKGNQEQTESQLELEF